MTNAEKKTIDNYIIHLGQKVTFWQKIFSIYPREGAVRQAWAK